MHHGRALVAPHRDKAGFVQVVAQFGQWQGSDFQHVHTVECRQTDAQRFAAEPVMVGRGILFGKTTGDQRLQIAMNLARRHLHVLGQARQRSRGRQLGERLEDVGTHLGGADFLFTVAFRLFHGGIPGRMGVFIA
ncbi:hypothetical protein D3C76_1032820 [compost metagenome]